MKKIITLSLVCFAFLGSININAQKKETRQEAKTQREDRRKAEAIKIAQQNKASIEGLNFSFYPTTIEPKFGSLETIVNTSTFYFTVDKTYLYLNLPYIGTFQTSPISPANTPIDINSNKFLYSVQSTDNINYQITILPTDTESNLNEGIKFVLSVNKNTGFAKLVVTADNRQEITYTGSFN